MIKNKIDSYQIIIIFILLILSFMYFLPGYRYLNLGRCHFDEGIYNYSATCILAGKIPYRDFAFIYTPGQIYILGFLFKIFGISLTVSRIFTILVFSLLCILIYIFVSKINSKKLGLMAYLLVLAWLRVYLVYSRPQHTALLLCFLSSIMVLNFLNKEKIFWIFISGFFIGLTVLFRQDFGIYILGTVFLFILFYRNKVSVSFKQRLNTICKHQFILFGGSMMAILPFFIYFSTEYNLSDLLFLLFKHPVVIYPRFRGLPFPVFNIDNSIFYIPIFIFFISGSLFIYKYKKFRINLSKQDWAIFLNLMLGLGLFNYFRIRTDISTLIYVMVPTIVLFVLLLSKVLRKFSSQLSRTINIFLLSTCFIPGILLVGETILELNNLKKYEYDMDRAKKFYDSSELAKAQIESIKYIQKNTNRNDNIFVASPRFDKVVNTDIMFYFLSSRKPGTNFYILNPAVTTGKITQSPVHKIIIDQLIENKVNYIVLWNSHRNLNEPNESRISSGRFLLNEFIFLNYKVKKDYGEYIILKRVNNIEQLIDCY